MRVIAIRNVVYIKANKNCPYEEEYDGNDLVGHASACLYRR